ncbi:TetR/AcrR family transcriptional regulator [Flindersiella endophytica]
MRGRLRKDDIAGRRERAEGILVAAGGLIERWGFDKTTVDDIARAAGVAKGTIYLHWPTRDALFLALLRQERLVLLTDVRQRLTTDCKAPIVRTLFRHFAAAMLQRPLLKAVFLGDQAILGRLAGQRPRQGGDAAQRLGYADYVAILEKHGAVRPDLPTRAHVNVVSATFLGNLFASPMMPAEYEITDDERADLIAETIYRTLGTEQASGNREEAALISATIGYVDNALAIARHQFDAAIGLSDDNADNPDSTNTTDSANKSNSADRAAREENA